MDLGISSFLLQKKAVPLDRYLLDLKKKKDEDAIKKVLFAFKEAMDKRCKKGISNRDLLNLVRNSGYIEGKVIEMDLGSFYQENKDIREENRKIAFDMMKKFLEKKMPSSITYLEKEL